MADDVVVVEEVCPSVEELTNIVTGIPCNVQGCSKILFNTAALRMHAIKTHNIASNDEEKAVFTRNSSSAVGDSSAKKCTKKIFYCPVADCPRGNNSNKPFPRLGQVKQHYMTVHAEKKFTCSKCSRGFGIEAACKRHESKCGQMFHCTCGCPFTTREALLMHARRKQHKLPSASLVEENKSTNRKRKSSCGDNSTHPKTSIIIIASNDTLPLNKTPITAKKYCTILPKPSKVDSTTNTKKPLSHTTKKDAETQTSMYTLPAPSNIQAASTQTLFGLQSNCIGSNILSSINQSSVGTQMKTPPVSSVMDFGSQVMFSGICEPHSSSVGTQHDGQIYMESISNSNCFNSQPMLTLPTPSYLNSSETQTQDFGHVTLEDNAAQTLISILDMDPSCSADCGTQTQKMFEEILSQTDVELTESQTQTWLSSLMPQDTILIDNSFNNRTTLEDLVNMQTQTVIDDIPFDVGLINTETQTIPQSFSDNCWGYETNNRQTQMTQTGGMFFPFDSNNTSLMDTYTQTLLGDTIDTCLSNVQTQT